MRCTMAQDEISLKYDHDKWSNSIKHKENIKIPYVECTYIVYYYTYHSLDYLEVEWTHGKSCIHQDAVCKE